MMDMGHNLTSGIRYRIPVIYSEPSPLMVFALVPTPIRLYLAMMLGLDVVKGVHVMAYRIKESKSKMK
jgi:hypothetical protein